MTFIFEGVTKLTHLAERQCFRYLRYVFIRVQQHIFCLAYFQRYIIRMGRMLCIRFKKMVEMRLAVADMCGNIIDRQIFRKMFSHIANGFKESALIW